jgi:6-pyruvoyltetrahydropterin/6-carboxytetrahydropterin synthase
MPLSISITKQYRTETGHRLDNYDGKCAHIHGHSYLFEVTATGGSLDERGMVADFKDLKAAMVEVLEPWDHAFIIRRTDPLVALAGGENALRELLRATNGESPRVYLWDFNPTAENMARFAAMGIQDILDEAMDHPPTITCVRVWETATSFAEWRLGL